MPAALDTRPVARHLNSSLAVQAAGQVAIYDTGDHAISGVQQQQGGSQTLNFSSQFGQFSTLSLPLIRGSA